MKDKYGRNIDYLRISITDKCNLRCIYCMPEKGNIFCSEDNKLSNEYIYRISKEAAKLGIRKIRLTGGEPLVRDKIVNLIKDINSIDGIEDIAITTNGILLDDKVNELVEAGLKKVNISLDTLKSDRYFKITRGGDLSKVTSAINKCLDKGIKVKLNVVIVKGINDDEIIDLMKLTTKKPLDVRFIELMPIGEGKNYSGISNEKLIEFLKNKKIKFSYIKRNSHDGPAEYIKLEDGIGKIGFISAMSNCFCKECNRIRITNDGLLKQCLNWRGKVNLKELLDKGISDDDLKEVLKEEIYNKPEKYLFKIEDKNKEEKFMNEIGG
ncbi:GTP 3',8-cyclase MoaA [Clostridium moniliforme]|uniref:GTP 3',8-cyclase MoaA n=1 Tax=Clostridium moniliforme TaxID=39489 RepID=UPI001AE23204|nr:GTP 3',8-cyclase MoaA [Clostridium moniliforme]